jgi:phytoene dehydrogenase-like protein
VSTREALLTALYEALTAAGGEVVFGSRVVDADA